MNKEYMYLSDRSLLVTDENGMQKRECYSNQMHEILLSENKVELADKALTKLEDELAAEKLVISLMKALHIATFGLIVIAALLMFILSGFSLSNLFTLGMCSGTVLIVNLPAIFSRKSAKKKIKKLQNKIKRAQEIKEDYEKEAEMLNEKSTDYSEISEQINEVISLEEENDIIYGQIEEKISKVPDEEIEEKNKRFFLGKTKKLH